MNTQRFLQLHHLYRRIAAALLVLAAAFLWLPVFAEDEPVPVYTAADLQQMAADAASGQTGGRYVLKADVDLTGVPWTPADFAGELDGNGHTIYGLTVTRIGQARRSTFDGNLKEYDTAFAGFFGVLEHAYIHDLTLSGVQVILPAASDGAAPSTPEDSRKAGLFVGGLAGYAADSVIENCRVTGTLSMEPSLWSYGEGGLVGFAADTDFKACSFAGFLDTVDQNSAVPSEEFMGGIYSAGYGDIVDCSVFIEGCDYACGYVHQGGLVGMYYPYDYSYYQAPTKNITGNRVDGQITFFEDNAHRRAYCASTIGEVMNWQLILADNKDSFTRSEVYDRADVRKAMEGKNAGDEAAKPDPTQYVTYPAGTTIALRSSEPIRSLYVTFFDEPAPWILSDGLHEAEQGTYGFLNEYIDMKEAFGPQAAPKTLYLTFPQGASVAGTVPFTAEEVPGWVQRWQPPCEKADVLLFSSHADDEQLFFAGILPYYSRVRKLDVQVVYFTRHLSEKKRHHERLDGLWTCGITRYPVMGLIPDAWADTYEEALANAKNKGFTEEAIVAWEQQMLERFRPKVLITHDEGGEYKHGQHMLLTGTLEKALDGSAQMNGTIDDQRSQLDIGWAAQRPWLRRVFLHLYAKNPVTLSFLDTPFEELNGRTPFEVTQQGFLCHKSQQWTWFKGWIFGKTAPITRADEIKTYSPLQYGLYYDAVLLEGMVDQEGRTLGWKQASETGDFFAGLTSYAEDRAEAERLAAEEAARIAREEAEKQAAEEARLAAEAAAQKKKDRTTRALGIGCLVLCAFAGFRFGKKRIRK